MLTRTERMEKRREIRKATGDLLESLEKARDALSDAIESYGSRDYESGLEAFEQADSYVSRARRRTKTVDNAFYDMAESDDEGDWRRR